MDACRSPGMCVHELMSLVRASGKEARKKTRCRQRKVRRRTQNTLTCINKAPVREVGGIPPGGDASGHAQCYPRFNRCFSTYGNAGATCKLPKCREICYLFLHNATLRVCSSMCFEASRCRRCFSCSPLRLIARSDVFVVPCCSWDVERVCVVQESKVFLHFVRRGYKLFPRMLLVRKASPRNRANTVAVIFGVEYTCHG